MAAIEQCRTPAIGGHLEACDHCDAMVARYHSCCDRHCPKCQTLTKERWIEACNAELLATPYYHLVFTALSILFTRPQVSSVLEGNPVYEAGGTIENRELPRAD